MRNEKIHSMLLGLVGGYIVYLAYQLFEKYRAGTKEMPDAAFIIAIIVFAAAGIGILAYAWLSWRRQRNGKKEETGGPENINTKEEQKQA